jgi:hypothetical protein
MASSGYYKDPLKRHFARFYNGRGWAYKVRDEAGKEMIYFDADLKDEFLRWLDPPSESDLLEAVEFEIPASPEVIDKPSDDEMAQFLIEAFSSEAEETNIDHGDWIQGFNSRVRLVDDLVEIEVQPGKKVSTMLFSSGQDLLNAGLRTIPLRTIQAVRLTPAAKGIMGALQFTVPGALTQQHRQSAGKVLKLLSAANNMDPLSSQAHENSVSFDLSQQDSFVTFHRLVVERLSQLGHQDEQQTGDKVDYVAQIRELKGLLDDGILTQEEFDSAKQEILKKF